MFKKQNNKVNEKFEKVKNTQNTNIILYNIYHKNTHKISITRQL